jgi:predicted transcriptional regulator
LNGRSAYTTVMTTLSRLYRKGLVHRRKVGRSFAYSAVLSRQELGRRRASRLFASLLAERTLEAQPILSTLVDAVGERDRALLEQLEEMVRRKREEG